MAIHIVVPQSATGFSAMALAAKLSFADLQSRRRDLAANFAPSIVEFLTGRLGLAQEETGGVAAMTSGRTWHVMPHVGVITLRDPDDGLMQEISRRPDVLATAEDFEVSLVEPTSCTCDCAVDTWHLSTIRADRRPGTGKGITVGVLDTGVDPTHAELKGKVTRWQDFTADGDAIPAAPHDKDARGHGTHVCGLIAGRDVGVAPGADVAVACVLPQSRKGRFSQVAGGMNWLASLALDEEDPLDVRVVCMSFGTPGKYDPILKQAVRRMWQSEILLVGAIGNQRKGKHSSPGNYREVLGVGATDRRDKVPAFSGGGQVAEEDGITKPDLCAPGCAVTSCMPGNAYEAVSGTSASAPIVAGAAAAFLSAQPQMSAESLRTLVLSNTRDVGQPTERMGRGRFEFVP